MFADGGALEVFACINILLLVGYISLIWIIWKAWQKLPDSAPPEGWVPATALSVIIPARNEETNILSCLRSLLAQQYPVDLVEIIVVDDFSEDRTVKLVENLDHGHIHIVRLAEVYPQFKGPAFKKKALEAGIRKAKNELIITTDADCIAPPEWFAHIAFAFESQESKIIAGPVLFHREKNLLQRFQALDYIGMMGVTGAEFYYRRGALSNGANLAFSKAAFESVGGYQRINHLASGDDMLLLEKFRRTFPQQATFLKSRSAAVLTTAPKTVVGFWQQRLRWASKGRTYSSRSTTFVQLWVFLTSWILIIDFAGALAAGSYWWCVFGIAIFLKAIVDFLYLRALTDFFNRRSLMRYFAPAFFIEIAYIAVIGLVSFFIKKYTWKGRRVQ